MRKTQIMRGLAGLALLALLSGSAFAAVSIPGLDFKPPSGDQSLKMLGTIFGDAGVDGIPSGGGVMGALMQVFNTAVLSLASIVAFYAIVSAVVQTAHDGEVLGKRYSSLWVPIRAATGVAMIVPVPSYSGVQLMVLWLTVQGVGLADGLFKTGFEAVVGQGGYTASAMNYRYGEDAVVALVPVAACIHSNMESIKKAEAGGESTGIVQHTTAPLVDSQGKASITIGFKDANGRITPCGKVSYGVGGGGGDISGAIASGLMSAQSAAIATAISDVTSALAGINTPADAAGKGDFLRPIIDKYNDKMSNALKQVLSAASSKVESKYKSEVAKIQDRGWAAAGESFMLLSKISGEITEGDYGAQPSVSFYNNGVLGFFENRDIKARTSALVDYVSKNSTAEMPGSEDEGLIKKAMSKLTSVFWSAMETIGVAETTRNPIMRVKHWGDMILSLCTALLIGALAAIFFTGMGKESIPGKVIDAATGAGSGAAALLSQVFLFVLFLMIGLIPLGIVFAVYIPMLPYIIWISVLIAWMVAVADAVIAAPLWMMMHINPEGEGISTGATDQGYKLVAAVFLRPALSVIAFFVASAVVVVVGGFVLDSYSAMYDSIRSSKGAVNLSMIFAWIGKLAVIAGLMMAIINKSFALTLIIPEAILRWIGAQLTGGGDMTGETKHEMLGAVGVVKGAGAQSMAPGMRTKPNGGGNTPVPAGDQPGGDKPGGGGKDGGADRPKPSNIEGG